MPQSPANENQYAKHNNKCLINQENRSLIRSNG